MSDSHEYDDLEAALLRLEAAAKYGERCDRIPDTAEECEVGKNGVTVCWLDLRTVLDAIKELRTKETQQ